MRTNRLRNSFGWISIASNLFLIVLVLITQMIPGRLGKPSLVDMLSETGYVVAVITGLLGLPRWPAIIGLGCDVLILLLVLLPDSMTIPIFGRL